MSCKSPPSIRVVCVAPCFHARLVRPRASCPHPLCVLLEVLCRDRVGCAYCSATPSFLFLVCCREAGHVSPRFLLVFACLPAGCPSMPRASCLRSPGVGMVLREIHRPVCCVITFVTRCRCCRWPPSRLLPNRRRFLCGTTPVWVWGLSER